MTCQCLPSIMNMIIAQVSFGSDLSNRAPTFDMDLSDFMDDGKPISYEKARELFCQDPSQKYENKFLFQYKISTTEYVCIFAISTILSQMGCLCCWNNSSFDD
jgi:hypothetical protein